MLRQERVEDPYATLQAGLDGLQSAIQTAMPAIIESFDPVTQTCTAKPALKIEVTDANNVKHSVEIALVVDIPVVFPSGGGYTLTFPVAKGDECLLVFSSRCIDAWWYYGGVQEQREFRMHDISDGFAFVGARSKPNVPINISTTATQLRSNDGLTFVEIDAGLVKVQADNVKAHSRNSYAWDVNGYGQKITHTGGSNYTIDNYTIGAIITTVDHAINPPDAT